MPVPGTPQSSRSVAAGRGDLERAARLRLAAYLGQVGDLRRRRGRGCRNRRRLGELGTAGKMRADLQQRIGHAHVRAGNQCGLGGVAARHDHAPADAGRVQHRRQHALHRAQLAGEREFADEFVAGERLARQSAVGGEDAERDRQVEAAAVLGLFKNKTA